MMKVFRPGAMGALADEYERVLGELKAVVRAIPPERFTISTASMDEDDFASHAGIISHVVRSGLLYADLIRTRFNGTIQVHRISMASPQEAIEELDRMFAYTIQTFEGKWNMTDAQLLGTLIKTSWSAYDLEALIEHAIVHVMRHRRQLEKLLASS